ncbi:MAG: hypothetical protein ABIS92_16105 [Polyangia bacterium]
MRDAFIHVALLLWTALVWTLGGFRICSARLRREEPLLVVATSAGLGAGLTAILLTVVAALRLLTPAVIWGIQLGWTVLAISAAHRLAAPLLRTWRAHGGRPLRAWRVCLGVLLAITALATLLTTLAPPTSLDATVYHLRIPREFLRMHRLAPIRDDVRMFQPLYVQMLFASAMGLKDDILAALLHWFLGVATALATGAWARRLGARSSLAAVAIFVLSPLVIWEATSCFIDFGLTLATALGLLWASRPDRGTPALALATLFAGLAAGSKFTGCASAALIGLMAALALWPDRRAALIRLLVVGTGALVVAAPWYIRNAILTGNPVYPLANPLFGGPPVPLSSWHYGFGHDLLHLLTSPFDLLVRGDEFDSGWATGPAYLALIPVALLTRRRTRIRLAAAGVIALHWLFWFYSSPQTRLLLPIFPLAAALASLGLEKALASGFWTRWAAYGLLAISFGVGLGTALITARGSARMALGLESRDAFLHRMTWDYEAYQQTNRRLSSSARLAVFGVSNVYYLSPPTTVVDHDNTVKLRAKGFSHLLRVRNCESDELHAGEAVIWHGKYMNPGSRFQGTYPDHHLCAQLVDLAP